MWVRSLSLPPPHPLVLTGKGRSFLQPKLPTLPLRRFLSFCVLCVSHFTPKVRVFAAFTAVFVVACCIFVCSFSLVQCFWVGGLLSISFLVKALFTGICLFLFFSAVICMVLCVNNLGYGQTHVSSYTVYTTQVLLLHSSCMNYSLT